jgi:hypothetical protein
MFGFCRADANSEDLLGVFIKYCPQYAVLGCPITLFSEKIVQIEC